MKRIYFLRPVGQLGPIKIGCSKLPEGRLDTFTIWSPVRLEIVASVPGSHADESALHAMFQKHHVHGEWFGASKELLALIAHCDEHGQLPELPQVIQFPRKSQTRHIGYRARAKRGPIEREGDAELCVIIRAQYDSGLGLHDLAAEQGCDVRRIRSLILRAGGSIRKRGRGAGVADADRAAEFSRRYTGGETLAQIAADYGISRERVRQILRKVGTDSLGHRPEHKRKPHDLTDAELRAVEMYKSRECRPAEIVAETGVPYHQLTHALRRMGVPIVPLGAWLIRDDDAELTATIATLYQSGLSAKQIVAQVPQLKFPETVYRYLKKAGIAARRPGKKNRLEPHADTIIAARQRGCTLEELARTFGASTGGISFLIKRHGVSLSPEAKRATRSKQREAVAAANRRRKASA